jgi:hypothetical protein
MAKTVTLRSAVLGLAVLLGSATIAFGADELLSSHSKSCKDDPEVARRIAQYRAVGEPVNVDDLRTPAAPDQDNAVVELRQAAAMLDVHGNKVTPWLHYDMGDRGYPMTSKERSLAKQAATEDAEVVPLVDKAMGKKGFCWPTKMSSPVIDVLLPDLSTQRALANFLDMDAVLSHDQHDDAAVLADIRRELFLERALNHHPPVLVVGLVAGGIRREACETIQKLTPTLTIGAGPHDASPTVLAQLIRDLLDDHGFAHLYHTSLVAERVMTMDTADALINGLIDPWKLDSWPSSQASFTRAQWAEMLKSSIHSDLPIVLDNITSAGNAVKCIEWNSAEKKILDATVDLGKDMSKHAFARLMGASFGRSVLIYFRIEASSRAAAAALAIRWYQADHGGALPPTLNVLIPKYLPVLPADPFGDGKALFHYAATGPDPKIYALCPDGTDNGGQDRDANGKMLGGDHKSPAIFHLRQQPRDLSDLPADLKD